jgi:metal-responsive CopG/Arc/MetJ family transcriptional regulator
MLQSRMAHHRINITLPTETLHQLDELVTKGNRSSFIHIAIQSYIAHIQKQELRQQLKAGAISPCRARSPVDR